MNKYESFEKYKHHFTYLNHTTSLENLPSILENGLLCRSELELSNMDFNDLAYQRCLRSRGDELKNYVPLFIREGGQTPFYHKIKSKTAVIHIEIKEEILLEDGVLISDKGLIRKDSQLFSVDELESFDKECLPGKNYWDVIKNSPLKDKYPERLAEVLVPRKIAPNFFKCLVFHNKFFNTKIPLNGGKDRYIFIKENLEKFNFRDLPIFYYDSDKNRHPEDDFRLESYGHKFPVPWDD